MAEQLGELTRTHTCGALRTDNVGADSYNVELSRERAQSVAHQLQRDGVPASRIAVHGFGEQKPKAPNDTEAGRQS